MHLLLKPELATITQKLNVTAANDANTVITYSDLAYLLQFHNDKLADVLSVHSEFAYAVKILYGSFKILGHLPFLQDCLHPHNDDQLTLNGLVIASLVHMGRIGKLWHGFDYLKLVFMSLTLATNAGPFHAISEKLTSLEQEKHSREVHNEDPHVVELRRLPHGHQDEVSPLMTAKRIEWDTFKPLREYDDLEVESMEVSAYDLIQVFTLLLMEYSIPQKSHAEMQLQLQKSISKEWAKFELVSVELVRYLNIEVTPGNTKAATVTYSQFRSGVERGLGDLLQELFSRIFKHGFLLSIVEEGKEEDYEKEKERETKSTEIGEQQEHTRKGKAVNFKETRLVNNASLAYISVFLKNIGAGVRVTPANLVELYNGSHSGFSIRSLELKIFKWQAPTVFIISGKRLKSKTMATNKRYQLFDTEFPRYFRSTEDHNRDWQLDSDKVTYLVFVNQPWRASNKKNFGDEQTAIMCILPRYDFFTSRPDPMQQGQLIYFNNLGMGLGFGNDQPVNKNNVRKYLPGNVSLTVEANLEFGVFRHIANHSQNTSSFFRRSEQETVTLQDYEDRFMITDLEVWGVGSTKELDEQRKQWEWEEKVARARQSVNMRSLGEDRAFLEMAGIIGPHGGGSV